MLALVTQASVAVRTLADDESCRLGELREGMLIDVYGRQGLWLKINHRGVPAFVASAACDIYQQASNLSAIVAVDTLELMAAPQLDAQVFKCLPRHSVWQVQVAKNGWLQIDYQDQPAYLNHAYVDAYLTQHLINCRVSSSGCQLYLQPSFGSDVITELKAGEKLEQISILGDWGEIDYLGRKLYLALDKLLPQSTNLEDLIKASTGYKPN